MNRFRGMRSAGFSVAAAVAALSGCSSSDDGYTRLSPARPAADAVVLVDGDRWVVETVRSGDDECVRLRVGDREMGCLGNSLEPREVRVARVGGGDDPRFVFVLTGDDGAVVRRWTEKNVGMTDTPTAPLPGGGTVAVIELGPDERPFGIQILSADRDLIRAVSLLD